MAKYYGKIGFASTVNTAPGVWEECVKERYYRGDILRNSRRFQSTDRLNDDIVISNSISIVADSYANENLFAILYAEFMGAKWKVTNVDVEYPRLTLTLGEVYNEQNTEG